MQSRLKAACGGLRKHGENLWLLGGHVMCANQCEQAVHARKVFLEVLIFQFLFQFSPNWSTHKSYLFNILFIPVPHPSEPNYLIFLLAALSLRPLANMWSNWRKLK